MSGTKTMNMPATRDELLFAAISKAKVRMVVTLLESGANPNAQDHQSRTPLIIAAGLPKGDLRTHIIRVLVNHGADVNLQDEDGSTVLMLACSQLLSDDIVRLIVRTGHCDPNISDHGGDNALVHSVAVGNAPAIRILVNHTFTKSKIQVDERNAEGLTPLQFAVQLNQDGCVKVLVNEGNANVLLVDDKRKVYNILSPEIKRPSVSINVQECSNDEAGTELDSLPVVPSTSMASLRLDKISLHSFRRNSTISVSDESNNLQFEDKPACSFNLATVHKRDTCEKCDSKMPNPTLYTLPALRSKKGASYSLLDVEAGTLSPKRCKKAHRNTKNDVSMRRTPGIQLYSNLTSTISNSMGASEIWKTQEQQHNRKLKPLTPKIKLTQTNRKSVLPCIAADKRTRLLSNVGNN